MRDIRHLINQKAMSKSDVNDLMKTIRLQEREKTNMEGFSPLSIREITEKIEDASKNMENIFSHIGASGEIPVKEVQEAVIPVIKQATDIPHLYHLFYELNEKDQYTYRHTICVGIIATVIGKWMNLSDTELSQLTLAATLHDIGKAKISTDILNKPGKLTQDEYEEMKLHTVYGYDLLRATKDIDERIALTALQHHEREDGRGYPFGLVGNQIDLFSKIVAIADIFHAMSSERAYHDASPFYEVMTQMQTDVFGKLDPVILLTFINKMMDGLVGKTIELTDGTIGSILMINPYDPIRCLVMSDDELIDLRYNKNLKIKRIIED